VTKQYKIEIKMVPLMHQHHRIGIQIEEDKPYLNSQAESYHLPSNQRSHHAQAFYRTPMFHALHHTQ